MRTLTPIEYERLQGFPDDWTKGVSDTCLKFYKMKQKNYKMFEVKFSMPTKVEDFKLFYEMTKWADGYNRVSSDTFHLFKNGVCYTLSIDKYPKYYGFVLRIIVHIKLMFDIENYKDLKTFEFFDFVLDKFEEGQPSIFSFLVKV